MTKEKKRHPISPERQELHKMFVSNLGCVVSDFYDIIYRPFKVTISQPITKTLEIYLYPAINPPGGRKEGEYKINLLLQGQKPGVKMDFQKTNNFIILAAYVQDYDVYVIFDHYAHKNFTPNTNVQFRDNLLYATMMHGEAYTIKKSGEVVIAATSKNLLKAISHKLFDTLPEHEVVY